MSHTPGPWVHKNDAILSESAWFVEPNLKTGDPGIPVTVVDLYGVMNGEDTKADAALICAAPDMESILTRLTEKVERARYVVLSIEDREELRLLTVEARKVLEKAKAR